MTRLSEPVLLLLILAALCSGAEEEKEPLQVLYRSRTITAARGSSITLTCDVNYDSDKCSAVHVEWLQNNAELRDPEKYLTAVNETHSEGSMRRRQVVTQILEVGAEDNGQFRCKASCESGKKSIGHNIVVKVEG